jgi:HAMP domain-containing protein
MALYETLLLRDVLRPLLAQLGARHRLPVDEVRAPITLRTKLVFFFSSVTVFTSGLVLLFALSPSHALWVMLASIGLALSLALGLVLLIVRDMVNPVRALEERSDEMARGELARPVPPSGEADEIGRLSFAFEEMRRALRDKLRSTESLNATECIPRWSSTRSLRTKSSTWRCACIPGEVIALGYLFYLTVMKPS